MKGKAARVKLWMIASLAVLIGALSACGEKDRFIERSYQVINDPCGTGRDFFVFEPNVLGKKPLTLIIRNDGKCAIRVLTSQPPGGTPVERLVAPPGTTKTYTIPVLDTAAMKFRWECTSSEAADKWCHGTVELVQLFQGSSKNFVNATFLDSLDIAGSSVIYRNSPNSCYVQRVFVEHKNRGDDPQRLHLAITNTGRCLVRVWGSSFPPQGKPYDTLFARSGQTVGKYFDVAAGATAMFFAECYEQSFPMDTINICGWRGTAVLFAE